MDSEQREKVRREAEEVVARGPARALSGASAEELGRSCLDLLAELEQAERERDEARERLGGLAGSMVGYPPDLKANAPLAEHLLFRDISELSDDEQAVAAYVGKLIAGRASLVEALRAIAEGRWAVGMPKYVGPGVRAFARDAIAAFEQESDRPASVDLGPIDKPLA